jgi:hypothetical protein
MISLANISHADAMKRDLPAIVAFTIDGATPTLTSVAISPIEERDPGRAVSEKPTSTGRGDEGSRRPLASEEATSEAASGCGWKLTYESDLNRVFLDLVERDSDALVMRIPPESLVKFLRSASDSARVRPPERSDARLDVVA